MHIPSGTTAEIDVLSFEDALKPAFNENSKYDVKKWIYVPNFYSEYRYILGTRGTNPLICIGINPSTAEPDNLDPTLKSVSRIAESNKYDSFIMFNVYSQRATRPGDMEQRLNRKMHEQNMKAFEYILSSCESVPPCVWAAWGAVIETRGYLYSCVTDMIKIGEKYNAHWVSAGTASKKGHPHHPLYLKSDSPLVPFDIKAYCKRFI